MSKRSTDKAKGKKNRPKTKLGIPDLEHSRAAVLRSHRTRVSCSVANWTHGRLCGPVVSFTTVGECIGDLASTEITRHTSGLPTTRSVHTASRLRRTAPGRRTLSVVFLMP
jgi:hypothetical protein